MNGGEQWVWQENHTHFIYNDEKGEYNLDMKEIWKPVPNWESLYEVSNTGKVVSLGGRIGGSKQRREIKARKKRDGYLMFRVSKDGKQSELNLHRIVAQVFISNPKNKKEVNHKNGIRHDNRVSNLEWVTPKENQQHAIKLRGQWRKGNSKDLINRFGLKQGITSTKDGKKEYMRFYNKIYIRKDRKKSSVL